MSFSRQSVSLIGLILALVAFSHAQKPFATPRQEKLLNGLKVLVWNTPGSDVVSVKVRIHSGSAFDPQEKEGVMRLLSDALFPTTESKDFFRDELGGSINVISTYDYVQIDATAKSEHFLIMLETVAQAIANPVLDKESTSALKATLLPTVQEMEKNAAYTADRAVTQKLFGSFPYGRPVMGSTGSLAKIDFADLRFAKSRLMTADNASVFISGNVDQALALRAARRYLGGWAKSDRRIPSTFRQPDAPDKGVLKVEMPGLSNSEVRYAVRGVSRSSKEFPAAEIYARILQARLGTAIARNSGTDAAVVHDEHVLPGSFILSYRSQASSPVVLSSESGPSSDASSLRSILGSPITEAEFSAAKRVVLAEAGQRNTGDLWLDVDTYRIASPADELKAFQAVTLADVNTLLSRIAAEPVAAVVVTTSSAAASTGGTDN